MSEITAKLNQNTVNRAKSIKIQKSRTKIQQKPQKPNQNIA